MQEEQDLRKSIGEFKKFPTEMLKNIENLLGTREIIQLSETCRFFEQNTRKQRALSKVHQFLTIFNDNFISLPFENNPELLTTLLHNYLELNEIRLNYFDENGSAFSGKLERKCKFSPEAEAEFFLKKFETYKNCKLDNEKNQSQINPPVVPDIKVLTPKIVGTINLHFLSTLYYKQKQYFTAWITTLCSFLRSAQSGYHQTSLIASCYYFNLLTEEDYSKAAKIICYIFDLSNYDQVSQLTDRPKLIRLLIYRWLENLNFFDATFSSQQKNLVLKAFFELNKTENLSDNLSNLLRNLKLAHSTYKKSLLEKFGTVFPYLMNCKDLRDIFSKLSIEELTSIDYKLLAILAETIPSEKIKDCVNFIKQNYSAEIINEICSCPYPDLLFRYVDYNHLHTYKDLDNLIEIMNITYSKHHLYPYSPANSTMLDHHYNYSIREYGNEFPRISKTYTACVVIIYLNNDSLGIVNKLLNFNYQAARYLLSFRTMAVLIEVAENCFNLLKYLSGSGRPSLEEIKPEFTYLYKIHKHVSTEEAKEFYKAHIENLSNEQLQRLCDRPLINRLDQRINALWKVFEADMFVNPPAKSELMALLAAEPLETLIALHKKNLFALYDSLTLSTATYIFGIYLNIIKEQNFENLEKCLKHPMLKKINFLSLNSQTAWFRFYHVLRRMRIDRQPGSFDTAQTFFVDYLNFLQDLDKQELSNDKSTNASLSMFDFFTNLADDFGDNFVDSDDFVNSVVLHLWQYLTEEDDTTYISQLDIIDQESFTAALNQETFEKLFQGPVILAINQGQLDNFLETMRDLFSKIGLESVTYIFINFPKILEYNSEISIEEQNFNLDIIYNFVKKHGFKELQKCVETYQASELGERNESGIYEFLAQIYPNDDINSVNILTLGN